MHGCPVTSNLLHVHQEGSSMQLKRAYIISDLDIQLNLFKTVAGCSSLGFQFRSWGALNGL